MKQSSAAFPALGTYILGTQEFEIAVFRNREPRIWRQVVVGIAIFAVLKQLYAVDLYPSLIIFHDRIRYVGHEQKASRYEPEFSGRVKRKLQYDFFHYCPLSASPGIGYRVIKKIFLWPRILNVQVKRNCRQDESLLIGK